MQNNINFWRGVLTSDDKDITHVALLCSGLGGKEVSGPEPSDPGGSGRGLPGAPKKKQN